MNLLRFVQHLVESQYKKLCDIGHKTPAARLRTAENIAAAAESIKENKGSSIPRPSLELGISQTPLHRILHKDLILEAYKVQLTQ